jgi:hypothetical protein
MVQRHAENTELIAASAIANTHSSNSGSAIAVASFCSAANCPTSRGKVRKPSGESAAARASAPSAHIKSHSNGVSTAQAPNNFRQASPARLESAWPDAQSFTEAAILCQLPTSAIG